ncbi:MAG: acetolactate synthase, large subunit, biosynthetic type, partial [Lachnospiraceae bacterium]|nr:acetolactate synthase, large subunit, biosynthetic type [Lachnospiraceae bacterium]
MIGAEAIIKCLESEDVKYVFGYPGVAICPFYNSILESDIKTILVRTEQSAAHAASGLARLTGKPGVCAVTSGPGATNIITGIATAYADSIPMVIITGQVKTDLIGSDVFQEADITGAVESFVKYSYLVKKAEDLPRIFKEAFYIAGSGMKGPVLIDIPIDVQNAQIKNF